MSFATDQMKKELEGYSMLDPESLKELNEAIQVLSKASDRITEILREGTVKPRHHGTELMVRDHVLR